MQGKKYFSLLPACGVIASLLFSLFLSMNTATAQEYSKLDSLKIGVKYKIILFDDTEIIGKIISHDSEIVYVSTGLTSMKIRKNDIFNISKNLIPSKYRFIVSAGGGISFLAGGDYTEENNKYLPMLSLQINAAFIVSRSKGYRIDVGYSRFKKKLNNQLYTDHKGGDLGMYYFKTEFMMGILNPSSPFSAYGTIGLGIHIIKNEEYSYKNVGSTNTITIPEETNTNAVISIGGGVGYRFDKHLGIYIESQYNIVTNKERSFLFGLKTGYFPVRAGLTYFIY